MLRNEKFTKHSRSLLIDEACPNVDYRYGPWPSVEDAFDFLVANEVCAIGLTIGVITNNGIVEYWFKSKADEVSDLVLKENRIVQELDPVFSSSPSASIKLSDIDYWNEGAHFTDSQLAAVDSGITTEKVLKYDSYIGLTEVQSNWINSLILSYLQELANKLITLNQSTTGTTTYYRDLILGTSQLIASTTVYLSYNGNKLLADSIPSGWTTSLTGKEYTYSSISYGNPSPTSTFSYTFTSGEYKDITVSKKALSIGILIINPAWYGILPINQCNNIDDITNYINDESLTLTRITQKLSNSTTSFAGIGDNYLVIITKGTASAIQLSATITSKIYDIPSNYSKTYLLGYKIYMSTLDKPFNGNFSVDSLTINL